MKNALTCALLVVAITGCASLQPQKTATSTTSQTCDQGAPITGSRIVEKTNCTSSSNVSGMGQSAYADAMRKANSSSISSH
jgi:hypothetical protein